MKSVGPGTRPLVLSQRERERDVHNGASKVVNLLPNVRPSSVICCQSPIVKSPGKNARSFVTASKRSRSFATVVAALPFFAKLHIRPIPLPFPLPFWALFVFFSE